MIIIHHPIIFIKILIMIWRILVVVSLTSCSNREAWEETINRSLAGNEFVFEKSNLPGENANLSFEFVQDLTSQLKLPRIDSGSQPLEFRVWCTFVGNDSVQLFRYFKTEGVPLFESRRFVVKLSEDSRSNYISELQETRLAPKSGWRSFDKLLGSLRLDTLPDIHTFEEFDFTEGDVVIIEISTRRMYKLISYVNVDFVKNKILQADIVYELFTLLKQEFGISRIRAN